MKCARRGKITRWRRSLGSQASNLDSASERPARRVVKGRIVTEYSVHRAHVPQSGGGERERVGRAPQGSQRGRGDGREHSLSIPLMHDDKAMTEGAGGFCIACIDRPTRSVAVDGRDLQFGPFPESSQ